VYNIDAFIQGSINEFFWRKYKYKPNTTKMMMILDAGQNTAERGHLQEI